MQFSIWKHSRISTQTPSTLDDRKALSFVSDKRKVLILVKSFSFHCFLSYTFHHIFLSLFQSLPSVFSLPSHDSGATFSLCYTSLFSSSLHVLSLLQLPWTFILSHLHQPWLLKEVPEFQAVSTTIKYYPQLAHKLNSNNQHSNTEGKTPCQLGCHHNTKPKWDSLKVLLKEHIELPGSTNVLT